MAHSLKDKSKHIFSHLRREKLDQQRLIKRSVLLRYGVAALSVGIAVLIKVLLGPILVQETSFLLVIPAIMISAWYGGLGPGLAATASATLIIDYLYLPPLYTFSDLSIKAVPLGVFVLEGVIFSLIVTRFRSVRKALRQSERLYRSVIERTAENIFLVDVKTRRIFKTNTALQNSLGYTAKELRQMKLYDIVTHDKESVDANIERVLVKGERCFVGKRRYRRKDGSLLEVEVNASVINYE